MSRKQFIEEIEQKRYVKEKLEKLFEENRKKENRVRNTVKTLLKEAKSTKIPSQNTGINVLEGALQKLVPVVREDYKDLTSSKSQRKSFRAHIINAAKSSLLPIKKYREASDKYVNDKGDNLDEQDPDDETVRPQEKDNEKFIDVPDGEDREPEEDEEIKQIPGTDKTGRNLAIKTFSRVESNIIDGYEVLASEEDRELYFDYLITNLKLYFDRWEEELTGEMNKDTDNIPDEVLEEHRDDENRGEAPRGWRAFMEATKKSIKNETYKKHLEEDNLSKKVKGLRKKYDSSDEGKKEMYEQQIGEALAAMWKKS